MDRVTQYGPVENSGLVGTVVELYRLNSQSRRQRRRRHRNELLLLYAMRRSEQHGRIVRQPQSMVRGIIIEIKDRAHWSELRPA